MGKCRTNAHEIIHEAAGREALNILVVTQYFWPERFRINDLVVELKKRGHHVEVLTGIPNYPEGMAHEGYRRWWPRRQDKYHNIKIYRVPLFLRRQGKGWQLALNYLSFVVSACLIAPWILRGRTFDIIFVYEPSPFTVGIPAAMIKMLKQAPMLFWVQDLWPESVTGAGNVRSKLVVSLIAHMVRWIYHRCDRVLLQSRAFEAPAMQAGARPGSILYYPNWAEDFYVPMEPKLDTNFAVASECLNLMFAGNLGEAQSLETILQAAQILHEQPVHWIIVGDGRKRAWMEKEAEKMGISNRISFLGSFPAEEMPGLFSLADVLLVTLKRNETFARTIPSKIQSYMACAKPIAAALDGEGARILKVAGCGLVASAEDGTGLAHVVKRFLAMDDNQRRKMGWLGREYYLRHFEREMLVTRLEECMFAAMQERICGS